MRAGLVLLLASTLAAPLSAQRPTESCLEEVRNIPPQPPSRFRPRPLHCEGVDSLIQAAENNCLSEIASFLEKGVPVEGKDEDGQTALTAAARMGQAGAARLLLDAGANPAAVYLGRSALCWGAGSTEMTRLFLERDLLENLEASCPYLAAFSAQGDADVVRQLISYGLDLEKPDNWGNTALVAAVVRKNYPVSEVLLEAGANPHATGFGDLRVSMIHVGDPVETCLLLKHGGDPNIRDARAETPLMLAARVGNDRKARLLLEVGADLNLQDLQGRTALMHALTGPVQLQHSFVSMSSKDRVATILLEAGADVDIKDNHGQTALSYAEKNGHGWIASRLRERSN